MGYRLNDIKKYWRHHAIQRRARSEFPMLFQGLNDYEKHYVFGHEYFIPRDLETFREIYMDQQYGDTFSGKILDIGSNTGLFCFYALAHGASSIVAYEPYEPVYNVMVDRIRLLGETRIEHHNRLICDGDGLYPYRGMHTIGCISRDEEDHFVESDSIDYVTLGSDFSTIKMDCEGSEYPIIKKLYNYGLLGVIPTYFVEIHDMSLTAGHVNDIFNMFEECGFKVTRNDKLLDSPYVHMIHFRR